MAITKRFATEDYVTEQKAIINEQLESVKNNTVLFTPQTLTEAQKAQARENLGIVNNTQTSTGTNPVTTEYIYTYDGDTNSDANTWIYNYGGIKSFVKLGDVPQGELNLVGASIFRTNPSNSWLNKTVTITEEHLVKTLNKSNTDIPATQEGLIQIFDIMNSDFSEFTILCICTIPGWYNVTFDDWYEIINFPEPGIYGYDKRTYGGNDYLKSFTFSATVSSQNPGNSSGDGNNNTVTTPIKYTGNEIKMFSRGICIGDSVTEGSFDNNQDGAIVKRFSYPAILKRLTNIDIANAGIAGMTSQTWYEASLNSDTQWGKWVNDEWVWNMNPQVTSVDTVSTALDYSNFDFAIIHLGINDFGLMGDITLDEMAANFVTNMMNIISKLKTDSPGIKIFVSTIVPSYAPSHHTGYRLLNEKITDIANTNDDVYLLDLNTYSELATNENYNVIHPTALGYHKLANEIAAYISYIIKKNLDEFKSVQFIGTNYTL